MPMNLIAIVAEHLWLIHALNDGELFIEIEEGETKFFYLDVEETPRIVSAGKARELFPDAREYIDKFAP
jgi:hypothetical protein